jgi:hypothetical protein
MNRKLPFLAAVVFLAGLVSAPAFPAGPGDQKAYAGRLGVMTQNLYVGANLFKLVQPGIPPEDIPLVTAEIFGDIQATDFQQRAVEIAALVAKKRPHLIGLQEVSLLRTQCPDDIVLPPNTTEPNATDVYADYLQILLDALAAQGLDYEVAALVENADVELPAANLGLVDCPFPLIDVRLTDYDVTLRRSDVDVTLALGANYQANLPVPTAAGTIEFTRGYTVVDAVVKHRRYRFVNTHLEVSGNPFAHGFQFAQAYELTATLDALAATFGDPTLVVVGDFNSDPMDGPLVDCMQPPAFDTPGLCPTPYSVMSANGYTDAWTIRNGAYDPGYTCCQSDLLMNPESWLDERIDLVWLRPPMAGAADPYFVRAVHAEVLGDRQKDRSADGLWPSDHAGVSAEMTFRQKK